MKLKESHFLFIITARGKLEDRFLYDIEYGILSLVNHGLLESQFTIVTDEARDVLESKCPCIKGLNVIPSKEIYSFLSSVNADGLITVSSCHGSIDGIDSKNRIEPYPFTEALKANPYLKNVIAVFGQCYAGIFNYSNLNGTNIVYLGVTDIDFGYSVTQVLPHRTWMANIPVLYTFFWLIQLFDIDKDGNASVIDLYKYVTFKTNHLIRDSEKRYSQLLVDAVKTSKALLSPTDIYLQQLHSDAMQSLADYDHVRQNTWILNANPACSMYVTL